MLIYFENKKASRLPGKLFEMAVMCLSLEFKPEIETCAEFNLGELFGHFFAKVPPDIGIGAHHKTVVETPFVSGSKSDYEAVHVNLWR